MNLISESLVGEMKREQSEECHDHDRLRVLN